MRGGWKKPTTRSDNGSPDGESSTNWSPSARPFFFANDSLTIAPPPASSASVAVGRAALPLEVVEPADRCRIDAVDVHLCLADQAAVAADRRRPRHARRLRGRVAGGGREARPAVLRRDDPRRRELARDRVVHRVVHALAEHGDERDEREPDHQRGRRRCRPRRVPHGVLRRERPAAPPNLRDGPAENGREDGDEPRRDAGRARDQRQSAEREREQRAARAEPVARHGVAEQQRGQDEQRHADERRLAGFAPSAACRPAPAAIGGDARRAHRRDDAGDHGHDDAEQRATRRTCAVA